MLTLQIPALGPTIRKLSDITTDRAPSIVESQMGPLRLHGPLETQGRLPMEPQNQTWQASQTESHIHTYIHTRRYYLPSHRISTDETTEVSGE